MHLLRLVRNQVKLGQPLPWGVRDAAGHLLLARGQMIENELQLEQLLERGASVDIEEVRAAAAAAKAEAEARRPSSLFDQWEQTLWQLDRALRSTAEAGFAGRIQALADHIVALTQRDIDIAIYLTVRQDPKRLSIYALAHSVHCAMVAWMMARRLGWEEAATMTLIKASLTMNIAILELQGRLAAQGVPPTPTQLAQIQPHPLNSAQMLRDAGVQEAAWLETVEQHHEQPDGAGYPRGLREIVEPAHALRLIDLFMAKLAPRADRAPLAVQQAAKQLFQDDAGGTFAAAIIKEFGIYPPGEFVQLKSGEQAVIVRRGETAMTPIAAAITDRKGMPMVSTVRRDTAKPEFAIAALAQDKSALLRVPPERLFGLPE